MKQKELTSVNQLSLAECGQVSGGRVEWPQKTYLIVAQSTNISDGDPPKDPPKPN